LEFNRKKDKEWSSLDIANDRDLKNIAEFLQEKLLITGSFQQKFINLFTKRKLIERKLRSDHIL
jgi:hypothetical protein